MAQEETRATERTLSDYDLSEVRRCDFSALVMPEIGIIRGVGTLLEDLYHAADPATENDTIEINLSSVLALADLLKRAINELDDKLDAAGDWFRSAGLLHLVMETRHQSAPPAGRAGDVAEKKVA